MEHETSERRLVKTDKRSRKPLIIAHQPPEARRPSKGALIDDIPGRQVIGHQPPGCACSCDPAQAVEDFAQAVGALPCIFWQQRQVRSDKDPFVVAHIGWVGSSCSCHTPFYHLLDIQSLTDSRI